MPLMNCICLGSHKNWHRKIIQSRCNPTQEVFTFIIEEPHQQKPQFAEKLMNSVTQRINEKWNTTLTGLIHYLNSSITGKYEKYITTPDFLPLPRKEFYWKRQKNILMRLLEEHKSSSCIHNWKVKKVRTFSNLRHWWTNWRLQYCQRQNPLFLSTSKEKIRLRAKSWFKSYSCLG